MRPQEAWPRRVRRTSIVAAILLLTALLAFPAAAHGPPAKRDQDTRLLADHNDDCGGHGPTDPERCRGTHDLVGLDLTESHDATHGDVVRLRLIVNGGEGQRRDVVTFTAGGATKTFELRTPDNAAFTGTGFVTVTSGPAMNADGTRDGDRVVVEGTIRLADLGGAGTLIDDVEVQAYTGGTPGDFMPGGYYNTLGQPVMDPAQGDEATNFERTAGYVLRGPSYYVSIAAPAIQVGSGSTRDVEVTLTNGLRGKAQTATLSVMPPAGITATWNGAPTATVDLSGGGSATALLRVQADATATSGTLDVVAVTDLGGRTVVQVPLGVRSGPHETAQTTQAAEDAPAASALLMLVLLATLAAARRRA